MAGADYGSRHFSFDHRLGEMWEVSALPRGEGSRARPYNAFTSGSKFHTTAKAETTGCQRATRRAVDSQPRGHSRSSVWCPGRRRCAPATRFRQWSSRRPSLTLSNRNAGRSIRSYISKDVPQVTQRWVMFECAEAACMSLSMSRRAGAILQTASVVQG
jgi:hypothetical protein